MRTEIPYYGYVDFTGDFAKQACWNQAIYVYGQEVIGYLYYDDSDTKFYTTLEGSDQAANGTYLTFVSGTWESSTYVEVSGQTPPTTTTAAPTTTTTTDPSVTTTTGAPTTSTTTQPVGYGLYLYKQTNTIGGRLARIEIWQKDYAGASAEIEALSGSPILLSSGNTGNDIYQPIIKSSLTLSIIDTEQIDYSVFFTPDATKFKFIYKLDGTTEWTGYLTPDSFIQSMSYRSIITLIARDNLGMLEQIPFSSTDEIESPYSIITGCLSLISFQFQIEWELNLFYITGGVDRNVMYSVITSKYLTGKTWYEALSESLTSMGAQIRYIGQNKYVVLSIADLRTLAGNATLTDFKFIEQSGVMEIQPAWKDLRVIQPYQKEGEIYDGVIEVADYDFVRNKTISWSIYTYAIPVYTISGDKWDSTLETILPSLYQLIPEKSVSIDPSDYVRADMDMFYIVGGASTLYPNTSDKFTYSIEIPNIENSNGLEITFDVSNMLVVPIPEQESLYQWMDSYFAYYFNFRYNVYLTVGATTYILKKYWEVKDESPTSTDYQTFLVTDNGRTEDLQSMQQVVAQDQNVKIEIKQIPFNGVLTIEIYPWYYTNRITEAGHSAQIDTDMYLPIHNFSYNVLLDDIVSIDKTVVNNALYNLSGSIELPMGETPIKVGNYKTYINGMFDYETAFYPPITSIHRTGETNYHLYDLISYEMLHHFKTPKRKLTGDIIIDEVRYTMPSFGFYYTDGTKDYLLNAGTLDVLREVMNVELIEITDFVDPLITTTTTTAAPTTTTTAAITTTTTSGGTTTTTTAGLTTTTTTLEPPPTTTTTTIAGTTTTTTAAPTTTTEAPYLTLDKYSETMDYGADMFSILVTSNVAWSAGTTDAWITVNTTSGGGTDYISWQVSENTGAERQGTIIVEGGGIIREYVVTQGAAPTTTTTSTTSTTTTIAPRNEVQYYGYGETRNAAWLNAAANYPVYLASIWYDTATSTYYTTETGGTTATAGYYCTVYDGGDESASIYIII